ncbi:MAG TPA: tRNA pseudouridine(55) synthase TruB [Vicinamibacterales bacterium]|nr:tRNA pseudouridine(55) synthase TruB [Vicinamibacterales bacterium]
MDGVLLIDKPSGPTSHDVVARLRRTSGEKSIGHTGTLDPRATGLLPLVLGRATRLASLLTGGDKVYEATLRLGVATDTDDADGRPLSEPVTALPTDDALKDALGGFVGTFDQTPPSHSAKKIGGRKAYELARREEPVELKPVTVTVRALECTGREGDLVHIRVRASSGFYVRALARDLGARLGCGAHLVGLRRTHSGSFDVTQALPLEDAERLGREVAAHVLAPADALPDLPTVRTTEAGLRRALHGNPLGPEHLESRWLPPATSALPVKVLASDDGRLVALARSRGGALHPVVVLG